MNMRVGVIGAGVMGSGIAQSLATGGIETVCTDVSSEALDKARELVRTGRYGFERAIERGKLERDAAEAAFARLTFTQEFEAAAQRESVQQCDRRERQILDAETDLLAASRSVPDLLRIAWSKLLDIRPGAKRPVAGPCQNQGAGLALGDLVESCFKAGHVFRIERVQCFWPVEPKDRVRTAPFDIYHAPPHKLESGKGGNPDIPVIQKGRR